MNIETLRKTCLGYPGTAEDVKWGSDLCFMVRKKMFCVTCLEPPFRVSFKVNKEQFDELVLREGIVPAPYLARNHWVHVVSPASLNHKEWLFYLEQSYGIIRSKLPKAMQARISGK